MELRSKKSAVKLYAKEYKGEIVIQQQKQVLHSIKFVVQ